MSREQKLIRLAADHAATADRIRQLKRWGEDAAEGCSRRQPPADSGILGLRVLLHEDNCIQAAFSAFKESQDVYGDGPPFEEVWDEMVAEGEVCSCCQAVRKHKADRMAARRRLGSIRAAITRLGRTINKENDNGNNH